MTEPVRRLDFTNNPPSSEAVYAPPTDNLDTSPLEALRAALKEDVHRDNKTYPVSSRPGVSVEFDENIAVEQMDAWRTRSKKACKAGKAGELDPIKLACIVVANQARAILMGGKRVNDDAGDPMLFYSVELQRMVGSSEGDSIAAIRKMYGVDGHLIAVADTIVSDAGYGDDVEESAPDPTQTTP